MWRNGWWGPFSGMWIFPLVILIVVLLFIFRTGGSPMFGRRDTRESEPTAREILDRRYARGEISREEYQQMKTDLK